MAVGLVVWALAALSHAQEAKQWSERRNLGFRGPVHSVLTTVVRPNSDPRGDPPHKLFFEGHADWVVFDNQGRRVEFASAISGDTFKAISKCTFQEGGNKVCSDDSGPPHQQRTQQTTLPDGSRETAYFHDSRLLSRDVIRLDAGGEVVASRSFDGKGRLHSDWAQSNNQDRWKTYDEGGRQVQDIETRTSEDETRLDRWSYDPEGRLVWHVAVSGEGELLSYWYKPGYKEKVSSSDSLGVCNPDLCVSYKFDEQGSGRLEKTVDHASERNHLEPSLVEHYNFDGVLDEKIEMKYARDSHGNWTSRTVLVWDAASNQMVEVERDTRTIVYY